MSGPIQLSEEQTSELLGHFNLSGFRSGQKEVLLHLLNGKNVISLMPTGHGKSFIYWAFAYLNQSNVILVVSPLNSLIVDQVNFFSIFLKKN